VTFGMSSKALKTKENAYRRVAEATIQDVFSQDYHGAVGLPFPKIGFVPPEHQDHIAGQYYISIGNGWQINLNFGQLPNRKKEFRDEVKILARHEIEHYRSCPYDIITYLRMIKTIIKTIGNSDCGIDDVRILEIAKGIANQFADVVVDTNNYEKYPKETLKSEIEWVKKGSKEEFSAAPRSEKLMFLLKEAIWGEDLKLNESEIDVKNSIKNLANLLKQDGIWNRALYQEKVSAYTLAFLELNKLDSEDPKLLGKGNEVNQLSGKRDDKTGKNVLFGNPDKIRDGIIQLSQETNLQEFLEILEALGIKQLTPHESELMWYEGQNVDEIPIAINLKSKSSKTLKYPATWKMGDPLEDLDLLLTLQTVPKIIPGISTKKWVKQSSSSTSSKKNESDLLLVIDSSGSMGDARVAGSKMQEAILASFGFIQYFERKNAEIALLNYSSRIRIEPWTIDYDTIKRSLLLVWGQGTTFPTSHIKDLTSKKQENVTVIVITDGEIDNWNSTMEIFKELLLSKNKIFLFLMGDPTMVDHYSKLRTFGGFVESAMTADDIRNIVFTEIHPVRN
jgi:hypothetical protein